ncbi:hypothetical protein AB0I84_00895 [Streptomyces spectabilis]|uniref:hypothetical protein n=1 Tax=Streptomyces spectabilis TaxID=68270 RepID=UPI0033F6F8A0
MSNSFAALIRGVAAISVANAGWVLAETDPNTWEFTGSAIAALVALEALGELQNRRVLQRQAAQN